MPCVGLLHPGRMPYCPPFVAACLPPLYGSTSLSTLLLISFLLVGVLMQMISLQLGGLLTLVDSADLVVLWGRPCSCMRQDLATDGASGGSQRWVLWGHEERSGYQGTARGGGSTRLAHSMALALHLLNLCWCGLYSFTSCSLVSRLSLFDEHLA